ncbi:tetratricopeptide repeat protein [Novipirellula aureliae]|nr:hypothetical protein [Novipirellula aureliae]
MHSTCLSRIAICVTAAVWIAAANGCSTRAPIHFWSPPEIQSAVGKRVAVSKVSGPEAIADKIHTQLLANSPRDPGRSLELVDYEKLQAHSTIQLVSAIDDQTSDVALASAARRQGYDYILRGEVLAGRQHRRISPNLNQGDAKQVDQLTMSWRLMSMNESNRSSGRPVVIDEASAVDLYPDLAFVPNPTDRLVSAAVRETYRLITPSIDRQKVILAVPVVFLGSAAVRRGNVEARKGNWAKAEQIWSEVAKKHPLQAAAVHNLALAAAAAQDFSRAKRLARQAIRQHPTTMYKETLVWIEQRQRDYHKAFNLPDPPEGWFVTR